MNCDLAFEYLTDSRRQSHPALQRHLQACPRCRQMQQTLEPAMALFESSADESAPDGAAIDSLYRESDPPRPLLSPEAVHVAASAAQQLQAKEDPRARWKLRVWLRSAALLVVVAGLTFAVVDPLGDMGRTPSPAAAAGCLWHAPHADVEHDARTVALSCMACHVGPAIE